MTLHTIRRLALASLTFLILASTPTQATQALMVTSARALANGRNPLMLDRQTAGSS